MIFLRRNNFKINIQEYFFKKKIFNIQKIFFRKYIYEKKKFLFRLIIFRIQILLHYFEFKLKNIIDI